ncbi:MAG: copper(I)-binding protein [Alphaproteobacteria bacterium]|jgi:copper(I)-binding protein
MCLCRMLMVALMALCAGLGTVPVAAHEVTKRAMVIDHPWARATIGISRPGVVYATLINDGKQDDALIGATSPVAAHIHVHQTRRENGVARMVPVKRLVIPAGGRTVLKPGGHHLMLMGLKQPLELNDTFSLTLKFEKAGTITMDVFIESAGSPGMMKGMKHGK